MKKYIVRTPTSDRTAISVPETLSDLVDNSSTSVDFTTGTTLTANYPITVSTGAASILGVHIIKCVNNTNPTNARYEAVQVADWTSSGGTLTINYITGLEPSTSYTFTVVIYSA